MSEHTHYKLQVTRFEILKHSSDFSDVRFEVIVGGRSTTGSVASNDPQSGIDTVTFSAPDASASLEIYIKALSRGQLKKHVEQEMFGKITIEDLLKNSASGEARLTLTGKALRNRDGIVYLHLEVIDEMTRVEIDVTSAKQHISRIERSADAADSTVDTIGSTVRKLDEVVKAVDQVVGKTHSYLNLAWQLTSVLYRVISNQVKKDKKLMDLVEWMEKAFQFARDTSDLQEKTQKIQHLIGRLLHQTVECCRFVQNYTKHDFFKRIADIKSGAEMDEHRKQFTELKQELDSAIGLHTASLAGDIHFQQRLAWLKEQLNPTSSDTSTRPRCLPQTRVKYLDKIDDWMFAGTDQNILWLKGIAGSGKSTIAASIRDICDSKSCLAAYLFFERGKDEHRSIIRSIAYQLAAFNAHLASCIVDAVERSKNITGAPVATQFETLLTAPLQSATPTMQGPVIIILDALDECGTIAQRREILKLLRTDFAKLPTKFRFLVTSRPENDIMSTLSSRRHIFELELEHTSEDSRRDVNVYLDKELREAVMNVPDGILETLSSNANGLFVWASTVTKIIQASDDPIDKLQGLAQEAPLLGGDRLNDLYTNILQQSGICWADAKSSDRFRKVIGFILFAKEAMTDVVIDNLLGLEAGKSSLTLRRLQSVVFYEPGQPIRLHHASFADYLTSPECSGSMPWAIDIRSTKQEMTIRCFDIMERSLCFNICELETSFVCNDCVPDLKQRVAEKIPTCLVYACCYWAEHLCDLPYSPEFPAPLAKLRDFVYNHLLHWFEVLSLLGNFKGIANRSLYDISIWTSTSDTALSSFLWDAYKLAGSFGIPISQSVPHIYLSALSLRKGESVVADHYSGTYPTVRIQRMGVKQSDQCIKVLKGGGPIRSAAVSTDGRLVATGSDDRLIRIWDAQVGELLMDPLKGHQDWVTSVAFSPDKELIASSSYDSYIRIWSIRNGDLTSEPLVNEQVSVLRFSPDGKYLASGIYFPHSGSSVLIWSIEDGKLIDHQGPLAQFKSGVTAITFLSNGEHLVTGDFKGSLQIWDVRSGERLHGPLLEHTGSITSVATSPDGRRFVSGSNDCTIIIRNSSNGEPIMESLRGHADRVLSVAFSPDGKQIVSGSLDQSVRVWSATSGDLVARPFLGHTQFIASVAFFPDGKRVVSASFDCTVRVWDLQASAVASDTSKTHQAGITSIAFSADGTRIVSGSLDKTVRVWDAATGKFVSGPFEGPGKCVTCVEFSLDRKFVVSAFADFSVRIWDVLSGKAISSPFVGHKNEVTSVAFSPSGKHIVSGSLDKTVRVWDMERGETVLGPLTGYDATVRAVVFSRDGKNVLSAMSGPRNYLCYFSIWSAEGSNDALNSSTTPLISVAITSDLIPILSGSEYESGSLVSLGSFWPFPNPLKWRIGLRCFCLAFTPGGKFTYVESGLAGIRVWGLGSSGPLPLMVRLWTLTLLPLCYSPCAKYVASGSSDGKIRIWDVKSMEITEGTLDDTNCNSSCSPSNKNGDSVGCVDESTKTAGPQFGRSLSTVPANCKVSDSNWRVSEDGWMRGDQGELLIWVPPDMRSTIWHPRNTTVISQFSTGLDFAASSLGDEWCKGYPRLLSNDGIQAASGATNKTTMHPRQDSEPEPAQVLHPRGRFPGLKET